METGLFSRLQTTVEVMLPRPSEIDLAGETCKRIVQDVGASQEDFETLRSLPHTPIDREGTVGGAQTP